MAKGCKICHALTPELDANGRCLSCARVKRATESGLSYGQLVAKEYQQNPWEILPAREPEPLPPDAPIPRGVRKYEKNFTVVCAVCGREFQAASSKAMYCSYECSYTAGRAKARQREARKKREKEKQNDR